MAERSQGLESTALWRAYREKMSSDEERMAWVKKVYEEAVAYLGDVRQDFKNYTLHDGIHVRNVLDAMGGLLGDWIGKLSAGEIELLILAACLHDLGMVYTDEERESAFSRERACQEFLREYAPELLGCASEEWPEDKRQWYLRTLHPFRISEVLQNEGWMELMDSWPVRAVPKRCVLAVCQAHGEGPKELRINRELEYLAASDADPLFCALLLRLADLLDFDDTRAPRVLYSYAAYNEKSREEWKKHQSSAGFSYQPVPAGEELPYKARCKNPEIEHAVRHFLDWVDEELYQCAGLQRYCRAGWRQEFPFPRAVCRGEIESDGYLGGDFSLTMDQEQILHLLMGENLYDDRDVFVRELLQNAIDATLLRGEMDASFVPEESHIDCWEWSDKEGKLWFRIDDYGTGMTLGMLQRYFLKVGNSYYTSQELKRDLRDHGRMEEFYGISCFGIGFLSCFLCGDFVEVSTLYFDPEKNRREEMPEGHARGTDYGIRLQVTGLKGYYTIRSQAENHGTGGNLPRPDFFGEEGQDCSEWRGYRGKPGTSIAIRLDPGKLGTLNLRETVRKYLCGARMPVYYNKERVGRTYGEAMKIAHDLAGERAYELDQRTKKKFDDCFPAVRGNYPKLVQTVIPLDTEDPQILPGFSGVLAKHEVCFERKLYWEEGGKNYTVGGEFYCPGEKSRCIFQCWLRKEEISKAENMDSYVRVGRDKIKTRSFLFELGELEYENLGGIWDTIFGNPYIVGGVIYQGIVMDRTLYDHIDIGNCKLFLLEGKWKPTVKASRSKIVKLPLDLLVAFKGIWDKYVMPDNAGFLFELADWNLITLSGWREVQNSAVGQWMMQNQKDCAKEIIREYQEYAGRKEDKYKMALLVYMSGMHQMMYKYAMVYLQDHYDMTINYEKGQIIMFHKKKEEEDKGKYDIFPPMMFCRAASDQSRKYMCHAFRFFRRGITEDHPMTAWLLENSALLNRYFQRQFRQMVECLCLKDADDIIQEYHMIREQLCALSNCHGLDVKSMPVIGWEDFWEEEGEEWDV